MSEVDTRQAFGASVADALRAKGLTQTAVAAQLGVTQTAVSAWVLGKAMPDISTIRDLAELVGVDSAPWETLKLEQMAQPSRRRLTQQHIDLAHDEAREASQTRRGETRAAPNSFHGKIERLKPEDRAYVEGLIDRLLGEDE